MSVHGIGRGVGATLILLLLAACGDSSGPGGDGGGDATLSGTVRAAVSDEALPDATVSIGAREATSDANGRFELTDVPVGAATIRARRAGYQPAEAALTLAAGANSHDFTLDPQEIYELGANAVYVPAGVGPVGGTIVTLGGPVTRGFRAGGRIAPAAGAPPELGPSLQALAASLRALARSARVALMGSSTTGMQNSPTSDATLFDALSTIATMSGQAGMADAPVLLFS